MNVKYIMGSIATSVTVVMQLPQIYHTIKIKKTKDISYLYLIICLLNHILWLSYGILDNINIPLILCDSLSMVLVFTLIFLKIKYNNNNDND